jgi:hypothetical protein
VRGSSASASRCNSTLQVCSAYAICPASPSAQGCRDPPPHFDTAAAIADPVFMNVVLCGIMSQLPVFQVLPAPQPQAPVARVYIPKIPLVTNKSAFQTEYWKKEENYLAFRHHNWDQWVDNIVRSLGLVSPLDRWIEHDRVGGGTYLPRPILGLNATWDEESNVDHWDQNNASVRKLMLTVITTDEARYISTTITTAKQMFDELKKHHRNANEFTLFAQWQKAFRCLIDSESTTQFREVPLEI